MNAPFGVNCEFIFLSWNISCLNCCLFELVLGGYVHFNISLGTSIKVFFNLDIRYEYEHSNSIEMDISGRFI
jgi:hypothetical protein